MSGRQRIKSAAGDVWRIFAIAATVAAVVGVLFFHVWTQYRITQLGYRIADVTHRHRKLLEENRKLTIEAAVQGRTERMSALARARFGLRPVRPEQIHPITLRPRAQNGDEVVDGEAVALQERRK